MWGILSCWRRIKSAMFRALARRAYDLGEALAGAAVRADQAARRAEQRCADQ